MASSSQSETVLIDDMLISKEDISPNGSITGLFGATRNVFGLATSFRGTQPWAGGIIPIEYAGSSTKVNALFNACKKWEALANVKCVTKTVEKTYLRVTEESGCFARVGSPKTEGASQINLGSGCWTDYVIVHELGHVLGFHHEHMRPDRDKYINIDFSRVQDAPTNSPGGKDYYRNQGYGTVSDAVIKGPYDFASIMHYQYSLFSKGGNVISPKDPLPGDQLGDPKYSGVRYTLSQGDADAVALVYGEEADLTPEPEPEPAPSKYSVCGNFTAPNGTRTPATGDSCFPAATRSEASKIIRSMRLTYRSSVVNWCDGKSKAAYTSSCEIYRLENGGNRKAFKCADPNQPHAGICRK